jgi:Flp pilus assembly protein TadD
MSKDRDKDKNRLREAEGWLELGRASEALDELQRISAEGSTDINVLRARYTALAATEQWNCALLVSEVAVHMFPTFSETWLWRAHAVRVVSKSAAKARDSLSPAGEMFPNDPIVLLNLALYESELNHAVKATQWLSKTKKAAGGNEDSLNSILELVQQDARLRELWETATAE